MFPQIKHIQRFTRESQSEQEVLASDGSGAMKALLVEDVAREGEVRAIWEYRHTGHLYNHTQLANAIAKEDGTNLLSPHLLKHVQWNVCVHGTVMRPVTLASILSRHTGQVGNSYSDGGLLLDLLITKDTGSSISILTDFTRTIWQISG